MENCYRWLYTGKGIKVNNCPIKQAICFPSCYFWANNKCDYDRRTIKELEDLRAMRTDMPATPLG